MQEVCDFLWRLLKATSSEYVHLVQFVYLKGNYTFRPAKNVSKQMKTNPKIETCSYDNKGQWICVEAIAVEDNRIEAETFMLEEYPMPKSMYSPDNNNSQVLYLEKMMLLPLFMLLMAS